MKKILFITVILTIFAAGCKKETLPDNNGGSGGGANGGTPPKENGTTPGNGQIRVQVPAGSSYIPAGGKIMSSSSFTDIDDKGYADGFTKEDNSIVYVFDKNDELTMAGFITDTSTVITPGTTALVMLYWGLKLPFYQTETLKPFIKNAPQHPYVQEWMSDFEKLFKSDPLVLSKGNYKKEFTDVLTKLRNRNALEPNTKKASIVDADANDIKSGIQIMEDGLSNFSVVNNYRRRAHAFLYKMHYTDINDNQKTVLDRIQKMSSPNKDFPVNPTSGRTSAMGEIGKLIENSAGEFFSVKSGPIPIPLEENEKEAVYKLRIVGPGNTYFNEMKTEIEAKKMLRLDAETFLLDFFIPFVSLSLSAKGLISDNDNKITSNDALIKMVEELFKSVPEVYEEIKKGDYMAALKKTLKAIADGALGFGQDLLLETIKTSTKVDATSLFKEGPERFFKVLAAVDIILSNYDIVKLISQISFSKDIEEWEIKAGTARVKLTPHEQLAFPGNFKKVTAIIKDLKVAENTHPFFEWSTSGKYGNIRDTKGHSGTSFATQDDAVTYYCNKTGSEENNTEYIYVKVLYGSEVIGTDTAVINVTSLGYKITPNGVTLSGKNEAYNEVALTIIKTNGEKAMVEGPTIEYKTVWRTAGKYGKLMRFNTEGQTVITTYNDDKMWYACTDDETEEAEEKVTATIYWKQKDEPESDYRPHDEVEAIVKINNDDKKRIIHSPVIYYRESYTVQGYASGGVSATVLVPPDSDAKRYTVRLYNFTGKWQNSPEGRVLSWNQGQNPPMDWIPPSMANTGGMIDNIYYLTFNTTTCFGCKDYSLDEFESRYQEGYGNAMGEITYYY